MLMRDEWRMKEMKWKCILLQSSDFEFFFSEWNPLFFFFSSIDIQLLSIGKTHRNEKKDTQNTFKFMNISNFSIYAFRRKTMR